MDQAKRRKSGRRGAGAPKMSDVARIAGVSSITVSRVLKAPDRVSADTRERVVKAMEVVGYVPNLIAGALASTRSNIIGVVVPTITNSLFADTVEGLTDVLRPRGYHLLIGSARYDIQEETEIVRAFLGRRVDAMVLTGTTHSAATRRLLHQAGIPVVEMWGLCEDPIDTVIGFSNYEASRQITLRLAQMGYRRIGYLGGLTENNDRTSQRLAGYLAGIHEAGLDLPDSYRRAVNFDFHAGGVAMCELLQDHPEIDAVFAASDVLAVGALLECLRRSWRVPGRVAIAGLDDSVIASELVPAITTVRIPRYRIGQVVGEHLTARLTGSTDRELPRIVDLGFEIIIRASTKTTP